MERIECPSCRMQCYAYAPTSNSGRWRASCNHCGISVTASSRQLLPPKTEPDYRRGPKPCRRRT
ncbi:hypothetical protein GCM10023333_12700 [Ferrimonas pelagia]|uniref:GATA-type domain-containing protein n=1 Tax=Ferrimonas pelagia TaxID=1177826 RepID=A0ABP9EL15_9GAMM